MKVMCVYSQAQEIDAIHPPCTARWNPQRRPPIDRVQVERPRPPSGASPVFRVIYHRPMAARAAAFFDLDRTLLAGASGEAFSAAMKSAGFTNRSLPGERFVYGLFNRIGETLPAMVLTRQAATLAKGRSRDALRAAGEAAA